MGEVILGDFMNNFSRAVGLLFMCAELIESFYLFLKSLIFYKLLRKFYHTDFQV